MIMSYCNSHEMILHIFLEVTSDSIRKLIYAATFLVTVPLDKCPRAVFFLFTGVRVVDRSGVIVEGAYRICVCRTQLQVW